MASSKEYLDFILEQLSELESISYRAMMGEYILYYEGKVIGGIYDDRFLVKVTKSSREKMPDAELRSLAAGKGADKLLDHFVTEVAKDMKAGKKAVNPNVGNAQPEAHKGDENLVL